MLNLMNPETQKAIIRIVAKITKIIKKEICKEDKKKDELDNNNH
jgi:hypothetical protein